MVQLTFEIEPGSATGVTQAKPLTKVWPAYRMGTFVCQVPPVNVVEAEARRGSIVTTPSGTMRL